MIYKNILPRLKAVMKPYKIVNGNNYLPTLKRMLNVKKLDITYGTNGKPYIANSNKYFSISHANNLTIIIVMDKPVGIDMELIREYDHKLLKYLNINDDLDNESFFKEWTKREAYIKLHDYSLKDITCLKMDNCHFTYYKDGDYFITVCNNN